VLVSPLDLLVVPRGDLHLAGYDGLVAERHVAGLLRRTLSDELALRALRERHQLGLTEKHRHRTGKGRNSRPGNSLAPDAVSEVLRQSERGACKSCHLLSPWNQSPGAEECGGELCRLPLLVSGARCVALLAGDVACLLLISEPFSEALCLRV